LQPGVVTKKRARARSTKNTHNMGETIGQWAAKRRSGIMMMGAVIVHAFAVANSAKTAMRVSKKGFTVATSKASSGE